MPVDDLACPAFTYAVLGFPQPTRIPCADVSGHRGRHWFSIEWTGDDTHPEKENQ